MIPMNLLFEFTWDSWALGAYVVVPQFLICILVGPFMFGIYRGREVA